MWEMRWSWKTREHRIGKIRRGSGQRREGQDKTQALIALPPYLAACFAAAAASSAFFAALSAALLFVLGATVGAAVLATAMDSLRLCPGTPSNVACRSSMPGEVTADAPPDAVPGREEATEEGRGTRLTEEREEERERVPGDLAPTGPLTVTKPSVHAVQ
jgi:hypothetical protein